MTRERAKELWPIIKAYSEGKTIQVLLSNGERIGGKWCDVEFDLDLHFRDENIYRIKPEPREWEVVLTDGRIFSTEYSSSDMTDTIKVREVLDD